MPELNLRILHCLGFVVAIAACLINRRHMGAWPSLWFVGFMQLPGFATALTADIVLVALYRPTATYSFHLASSLFCVVITLATLHKVIDRIRLEAELEEVKKRLEEMNGPS